MKIRFFVFPLWLSLVSCQIGPKFQLPEFPHPSKWKNSSEISSSYLPDEWWKLYGDQELNRLIKRSFMANQDLAAAKSRVETARALVSIDRSKFFPILDLAGSAARQRSSESASAGQDFSITQDRYQSRFQFAYDPDLWGIKKRTYQASSARAAAAEDLLDSHRLDLAAEVSRQFFLIEGLNAQIEILKNTIKSRQESIQLLHSKLQAGLSDGLAVSRAQTEYQLAKHDLSLLERQQGSATHALAVLCGSTPSEFHMKPPQNHSQLPKIRPYLPAEILQRRPDVRAAEKELQAANEEIGIAQSAFYPQFSLGGSAGFESLSVSHFLDWENRVLSLAANLSAPVFDAGKNTAHLKKSRSYYDQALAQYRQSLLIALREVEDAMTDLINLSRSKNALKQALQSSIETQNLSKDRYNQGLVSYLEVIEAERTTLQIQLLQSQVHANEKITFALLAKSLGGGWREQ